MKVIKKFDKKDIVEFGTSYDELSFKDGSFSRFSSFCWVRYKEGEKKRLTDDWKIKALKREFDNYQPMMRVKNKVNKSGKNKKVTIWDCKVYIKKSIRIPDMRKALLSLEKKLMYYIPSKKQSFFFVYDKFYKNSLSDEYLYMDIENSCFRRTGLYAGVGQVKKENLDNWIIDNM